MGKAQLQCDMARVGVRHQVSTQVEDFGKIGVSHADLSVVEPLQVLEEQQQRLGEAFPDQQTGNGFEGSLTPDHRIHRG